jgi:hypothetical protein
MPFVRDRFEILPPDDPEIQRQAHLLRAIAPLYAGWSSDPSVEQARTFVRQGYRILSPEDGDLVALGAKLLDHLQDQGPGSEDVFRELLSYLTTFGDLPSVPEIPEQGGGDDEPDFWVGDVIDGLRRAGGIRRASRRGD